MTTPENDRLDYTAQDIQEAIECARDYEAHRFDHEEGEPND